MQANDSAGRYLPNPHAVDRKRDLHYRPALQKNVNARQSKTFEYIAVEITSILIKVPGTRPELRYGTDVISQMLALRRHHADADQHVYCFRRGDAGFAAVEKIVQEIEGGGCFETPEKPLEDDAVARPGWDPKDISESQKRSASRTQQ